MIKPSRASQRFALPALGRAAGRRPTGKMLRRRKMLGIAPESPASGARFVRPRFIFQKANLINDSLHDSIVRLKFDLLRQEEFLLTQLLTAQLELRL